MNCEESIKWLDSLIKTLGQSQYQSLWNWEQPLTEIKEMLESKRVMELPCKVGDRIWYIPGYVTRPHFLVGTITDIQISSNDYGVRIRQTPYNGYFTGRNFNVNWFTDREKAEQKLKELRNK